MNFRQKLDNTIKKNNSLLCIGLDPDLDRIPKNFLQTSDPIFEFNKSIIYQTHDLVCTYKPNIAFYEAYGIDGLKSLKLTMEYLRKKYPEIPIILDAKRGDIPNTAEKYAKSVFEYWNADAVTIFPNLGLDSILPFLKYKDKLTILLIKTSNPDSKMFQDISFDKEPYFIKMAKIISKWKYANLGIFVGATFPEELKRIRNIFPETLFLSAGLGAQDANIERSVKTGINNSKSGIMFNAGRSIIYSNDPRNEAIKTKKQINKYR